MVTELIKEVTKLHNSRRRRGQKVHFTEPFKKQPLYNKEEQTRGQENMSKKAGI